MSNDERDRFIEAIMRAHRAKLEHFAIGLQAVDAGAAVSDAFEALLGAWPLKCVDTALSWLFQTVRHKVLDQIRRRGCEEKHTERMQSDTDTTAPSAEDEALRQLSDREIRELIRRLPPRQRDVVELQWIHGWRTKEIAEKLGINEGTVRKHNHDGIANLRKMMESE